jgi:hypothetical protein
MLKFSKKKNASSKEQFFFKRNFFLKHFFGNIQEIFIFNMEPLKIN